MESPALGAIRAAGLQAPAADLQSLRTWRCQDSPPTRTLADEVLGSALPGGPSGHAGQPRETDRRRGRGREPRPRRTARPRGDPAAESQGATRPPGVDTQTRQGGEAPARHPDDARPRRTNPRAAGAGTRMGGSLRAPLVRVPPGTLRAR